MTTIRNVLLDLDGTLIDSSSGVIAAVNYALKETGHNEQPAELICRYIGSPLDLMFRDFTDHPYEELRRHFRVKARETIVASTNLLPGAAEVVAELHGRGYRLAIATTKIRPHIEGILAKFSLQSYFATYAGADDVTRVKPDPEILRLILDRLDATPESSIMVGDTMHDLHAAQAVPITAVMVASPFADRDEILVANPGSFIESLAELPSTIERLSQRKVG